MDTLTTRPDGRGTFAADIAAEDWDLLFRAALERLQCVAIERQVPAGAGRQLPAPPGASLSEVVDALDQLRKAVPWAAQVTQQVKPGA